MSWMQKKDPRGDPWKCLRRKRGCNGGAPKENLAQKKRLLLWKRQHFLNTHLQTVECIILCPYISPLWEPKISADKLFKHPQAKKKNHLSILFNAWKPTGSSDHFFAACMWDKAEVFCTTAPLHLSLRSSFSLSESWLEETCNLPFSGFTADAVTFKVDGQEIWGTHTHTHTRADTTSETTPVKDDTAVGFSICSYKQTQTGHVVFWPLSFSVSQSP